MNKQDLERVCVCVCFHLYLTGQGKPRDSHVGVQHLELGLQRQSHAGKRREYVRGKTKFCEVKAPLLSFCHRWDTNAFLFIKQAAILMLHYLELRGNLVVASAVANLVSGINPLPHAERTVVYKDEPLLLLSRLSCSCHLSLRTQLEMWKTCFRKHTLPA